MIILGIDPGLATVGWGVISTDGSRHRALAYGALTTPAGDSLDRRLCDIHTGITEIIKKWRPDAVPVEELFFNTNITTGIRVAEARGVILLCARQCGVSVCEYTPLQVKQAVVGYGRAEKKQVQEMTRQILGLSAVPKPDDTADALALAVCHAHACNSAIHRAIK